MHGLATWCMAGLVGAGSVRRPPPVRPQPCCSYTSPPPDTGHVIIVCSRDFNIWFNGTWNFVDRITWQHAAKRPTVHINTLNVKLNTKWQSKKVFIFLQVLIFSPNPITFKVQNINVENFENVLQASCYVIIMHHSFDHAMAMASWPTWSDRFKPPLLLMIKCCWLLISWMLTAFFPVWYQFARNLFWCHQCV